SRGTVMLTPTWKSLLKTRSSKPPGSRESNNTPAQLHFQLLQPAEEVAMRKGVSNVKTTHPCVEGILTFNLVAHIGPWYQPVVYIQPIGVDFFVIDFHTTETIQFVEAIIS